jgi:hypothetical protein
VNHHGQSSPAVRQAGKARCGHGEYAPIEFEIDEILDSMDQTERMAQDEVLEMTDDNDIINAIDNERIG